MSELKDKVRCVASNMTTIIRRMEKQELVVTFKNSTDKRQTLVSLTQKGIDVVIQWILRITVSYLICMVFWMIKNKKYYIIYLQR